MHGKACAFSEAPPTSSALQLTPVLLTPVHLQGGSPSPLSRNLRARSGEAGGRGAVCCLCVLRALASVHLVIPVQWWCMPVSQHRGSQFRVIPDHFVKKKKKKELGCAGTHPQSQHHLQSQDSLVYTEKLFQKNKTTKTRPEKSGLGWYSISEQGVASF